MGKTYRISACRDPSGKLTFTGKAILHSQGVDFSNGSSYKINMSELEHQGELGKGQYGIVQRVRHLPTGAIMGKTTNAIDRLRSVEYIIHHQLLQLS